MKFETVKGLNEEKFRRLTGFKRTTFDKMVGILEQSIQSRKSNSGYTGIKKLQRNTKLPKKSGKKKPLTPEEKKQNREISSERVVNENVIGSLKKFKTNE